MITNAERQARWRENNKEAARAADRERHRKLRVEGREAPRKHPRNTMREFIALDGEGAGTDEIGRQNYQLLRAGDIGSFNKWIDKAHGSSRLQTHECLNFILSMPREAILVGYFFGYDVTQILRDLPPDRLADLFASKEDRKNRYTYWEAYGIEYVPKQYFRVCRIDRNTLRVTSGSSRTINEVGSFFQKSFVEAIRDWQIGAPETVDMIARNKDRREQFTVIGAEESEYCKQECRLLAQLMTKFRETCVVAGIVPRHWRGAGHIAARLHELHKTPTRKTRKRPKIIDRLAEAAYYGGRFEITTIGQVRGAVWEYDINSAYPAAMLQLPCPIHGRWKRFRSTDEFDAAELYISDISFRHPDNAFLCGFPIRENGRLYFPKMGSGIYWSPEINAAKSIGAEISYNGGYYYSRKCSCKFFDWVRELYEYRKEIGKQTEGYPIKLGINGLYGKFAQRIGAAPWRDYVMASLITSFTRAKIIEACVESPNDILYIATDAVYSRRKLRRIDLGLGLGQWEESKRSDIFIVQPGIYWSSGTEKPKTRGIPRSIIIENRERFERAWKDWIEAGAYGSPPVVSVYVNQFVGLRAALARGKPELAGSWLSDLRQINGQENVGQRSIDFDWNNKRRPVGDYIRGNCMVTQPFDGRLTLRSEGYDGEMISDFASQLIEREDDPDFMPWGNSGE